MIYYVEYDRSSQKLRELKAFSETERAQAQAHALARELEFSRQGLQLEIVLLEADSEATIRNTHPRYFGDPFSMEMRDVWRNMPVHSEKLKPTVF